ncbi:hypothetical protein GCM10010232_37970 [Streptomyces amakusaensis]|uniref:Integral membrane protein n=1 Tax=Streptomyces amakusaensis TaxID=67271 RepID=A0ABW0AV17_9ACTN
MTQSATPPRRGQSTVWSLTLGADALVTSFVALAMVVIGLLLPAIVGNHEMSTAEHFAEAAVFLGSAVFLIASLGATSFMVHKDRRRGLAQRVAAARLLLLVAGAASVIIYGAATH